MCILPKETHYFECDHARTNVTKKPKVAEAVSTEISSSGNNTVKKRRVQKTESIKVNCSAKITKVSFYNGSVNVVYSWKHINHDPLSAKEMYTSRLPTVIKDWINEQVKSNMDWKFIKATLRMSEESLDNVSYDPIYK